MKRLFINSTYLLDGIRFVARFLTVILFISLVTIYFNQPSGNRNLNPFVLPLYEAIMDISFYLALLGLLIAFKKEGLGGFLTIVGLLSFSIFYYLLKSKILWNIWIFGIPAILFLICWWYINISEDYDIYRG